MNTITSLNSSGPLNYPSACLTHFLLVQRLHELVMGKWMYNFPHVKIISGDVSKTVVNFKNNQGFCSTEHTFLQCLLSKTHAFTLLNLPNWSFFMTATYFSSRDRKTDKGLGFTAAFLEYSAIFFSVV